MPKQQLRQELFAQKNLDTPQWFDNLELNLKLPIIYVQFPHELFQKFFMQNHKLEFEQIAQKLWGLDLIFKYGLKDIKRIQRKSKEFTLGKFQFYEFGENFTFNTYLTNNKYSLVLKILQEFMAKAKNTLFDFISEIPADKSEILVLCGENGTGKTHLLRAIGNELFPNYRNKLLFALLEDLEALFTNNSLEFRDLMLSKQVLLIDNFQYISNNQALQAELCFILDKMLYKNTFIVFSGTGQPKDWKLIKALSSRLEAGMWLELPETDLDIRLRFAINRAKIDRLNMSKDKLLILAQHAPNLRKLDGLLKRCLAQYQLLGRPLVEVDILAIIKQNTNQNTLTPQGIIGLVSEHFAISTKELLGDKRKPKIVKARQMAMYLCRELLGYSYPVIGRIFKGKDHSTVIYGVKKIKDLKDSNNFTNTEVTELTKLCLTLSNGT